MRMLLLLLLSAPVFAQDACAPFVTRLHGQMELRDYANAFATFETAPADCAYTAKAYDDIEQLLKIRLDNAKPEEKSAAIDALFAYYDKFDQVNPSNSRGHLVRKAKAYKRYADDTQQAYQYFERAYLQDRENFNDAEALYDYFTGYHAQYATGKVKITDLIARYSEVSAKLAQQIKVADRKQPYRFATKGIEALMDRELTCEKLLPVYTSQFAENQDNVSWLAQSAATMERKKCVTDTLYVAIVGRWHKAGRSPESAMALSEIETRRGSIKLANDLLLEGALLEKDPLKRADILYRIATRISTTDPAMANIKLTEALEANPKMGRALLLRASLYANSNCGTTDFERKAMNFLAVKTAMQAASAQPELKAAAEAEAARYKKNAPTADEIKSSKMGGKTLKINCWVNESVQIPAN